MPNTTHPPFIIRPKERLNLPSFLLQKKHDFVTGVEKISIITEKSFAVIRCISANQSVRENKGVPVDIGTMLFLLQKKPELKLLAHITRQRPVTPKNPLYIFCSGSRINNDEVPVIRVENMYEISIDSFKIHDPRTVNGCQIRYFPKN